MYYNYMELFDTKKLLQVSGLFWQYPVKTEEEFYNQNKDNPNFCGIPWATIIDKNIETNSLLKFLLQFMKHKYYYTCCQHIHFRKILPLMKILGIRTVYTPHKEKNENELHGINLLPCPLYAVNFEDNKRNKIFIEQSHNFLNNERNFLYSFMGGYQNNYLTDVRKNIFTMKHPENTYIKNTGTWHFNNVVYSTKQNKNTELNIDKTHIDKTEKYNKLLLNSRFSLCPSGSGPNSIRFWESLACGSIPILLADTLELPYNVNWNDAIIHLEEKNINNLESILSNISLEREKQMRANCISIYNRLKNNYIACHQNIIHYCCGSYDIGDFGGVARYDYHILLAFPHRIFIKGPQQKNYLLKMLSVLDDPIVITDNHLSCDIPNKYKVLLVHHGSALTHAEREPQWSKYWKELCCTGQKNMLKYRDSKQTEIISISKFCTDEFTRFFPKLYKKFNKTLILHTTELNYKRYKTSFNNKKPILFGNFSGFLKGEHVFKKLKSLLNSNNYNYTIEKLNCKYNPRIHKSYKEYNIEKQNFYLDRDIFIQLSLSEGNSYATLDAFACGNVIIATNVGLTYKDVPDDCYIKLDYKKINDIDYLLEKIKYAWDNRYVLSKNARQFFLDNCTFDKWNNKMFDIVNKK